MRRPYRVSWWDDPNVMFELNTPWWEEQFARVIEINPRTQYTKQMLVAAVMATSPEDAKRQIQDAYEDTVDLDWIYVVAEPLGWSPFTKNRPKEPGVVWDQLCQ